MILTDKTDGIKAGFREQGFCVVERLVSPVELSDLSSIYDRLVTDHLGGSPDNLPTSLTGHQENSLHTVLSPEGFAPELKDTSFHRNALALLASCLEVDMSRLRAGWRLFFKPPLSEETGWHQDAAYRPPPHNGGSVWMPLDSCDLDFGCIHYVPGSHLGPVQEHQLVDHHLVTEVEDSSAVVACPINAGDATVHHCKTLHWATPNRTDRARRAIVVVCQIV